MDVLCEIGDSGCRHERKVEEQAPPRKLQVECSKGPRPSSPMRPPPFNTQGKAHAAASAWACEKKLLDTMNDWPRLGFSKNGFKFCLCEQRARENFRNLHALAQHVNNFSNICLHSRDSVGENWQHLPRVHVRCCKIFACQHFTCASKEILAWAKWTIGLEFGTFGGGIWHFWHSQCQRVGKQFRRLTSIKTRK
jgi:hypothetical protein